METLIRRLAATFVVALFCGIPLWIYLLADAVLSPEGFWQNLVLMGVGLYFLWFVQAILIIAFFALLVVIWTTE